MDFGDLSHVIFCVGDMRLPSRVQEAMQMQVEAERKKRAAILESEGSHLLWKNSILNI